MSTLSKKDKEKPFILIGSILLGILIQKILDREIPQLIYLTEIGVFFVILAVMLPIEIKDISNAFKKIKLTAIALLVNFLFIPLFSWIMGGLFLKNYPDFWVGAILYTLTPCIGWYLIFTDIAKGDVAWGIALLPWNIILQVILMPFYLYVLVGKVISIKFSVLFKSVGLFLVAPFVLGYVVQKYIILKKGRDYFFGTFKSYLGEFKLWSLVLVIITMFVSQRSLSFFDIYQVGLLILFLIVFFFVLFLSVLFIGYIFKLGYEHTVTMAFTTTARNSEAVIGVAVSAFPGHPLVYFAILLGPVVELPMLLFLSRILLALRENIYKKNIYPLN